ncbi:UNVERIFIED_CONTAM: hypothetical protein RKD50_000078 [Streptomyces canus]
MLVLRVGVVSLQIWTLAAVESPARVGDFRMVSTPVKDVVTR